MYKVTDCDPEILMKVQREVVNAAGMKESAARELQRALMGWFADVVPIYDARFHRATTELTELAAGVALAHVSCAITIALRHRPRVTKTSHHPSTLYDGCDLGMNSTAHIAALAQLAPHATNLRAATLSLVPDSKSYACDPLLWLAACRFLFPRLSQMPFPPQHLCFRFTDADDEPRLASGLVSSLLAQRKLHTLLESIQLHVWTDGQEDEIYETVPPSEWPEIIRRTVNDIRTAILLGVYRSKTSPLRILSPAVVPMILTRIKACSFTLQRDDGMETEYEDESSDEDASKSTETVWRWYD